MHGPTHKFCPNCNAMLPPHLDECPRCGQDLAASSPDFSFRDIFQITGTVLLIAVIPLILLVGIGALCIWTMQ